MPTQAVNDATFQVILNLMNELWVVKDRAALLEKVLAESGIDITDKVDLLQPDAELEAQLERDRKAFIARVLAPTLEAGST